MSGAGDRIRFRSERVVSRFNDPRQGFAPIDVPCETRRDPLTGTWSRIAHIDLPPRAKAGPDPVMREKAPPIFVPPLVHEITPTFAQAAFPEGRLTRGRSVLFPNLNPYDGWSPVVAVGDKAYVEGDQLDPGDVADGFELLREFMGRVPARDAAGGLIGWNFLPAAGSSIPHPHIQAIAAPRLTDRQRRERRGELAHLRRHGTSFWDDLVAAEKGGPRWVGGDRHWGVVAAFASRSVIPEVWLVHRRATDLIDATAAALESLAGWLCRLATVVHVEGFYAFNVIVNPTGPLPGEPSRLRARFLPRMWFSEPLHSADSFWLNLGTEEGLSCIYPEAWAETLRSHLG